MKHWYKDDLSLEGRSSVRTLMQWSDEKNGGFSSAPPEALSRPVIREGDYGYEQVNVNDQRRDPHSLLNWMARAIRTRKACPEFGWGKQQLLETGDPHVFAHLCQWKGGTALAVHNLSAEERTVTLESGDVGAAHLIDPFGDRRYEPLDRASRRVQLSGYGYRWFRSSALHPGEGGEEA